MIFVIVYASHCPSLPRRALLTVTRAPALLTVTGAGSARAARDNLDDRNLTHLFCLLFVSKNNSSHAFLKLKFKSHTRY